MTDTDTTFTFTWDDLGGSLAVAGSLVNYAIASHNAGETDELARSLNLIRAQLALARKISADVRASVASLVTTEPEETDLVSRGLPCATGPMKDKTIDLADAGERIWLIKKSSGTYRSEKTRPDVVLDLPPDEKVEGYYEATPDLAVWVPVVDSGSTEKGEMPVC